MKTYTIALDTRFPKGRMVIKCRDNPSTWHVIWFKNGRGRGRQIKAGYGVIDAPEYARETYRDFTEMGQI